MEKREKINTDTRLNKYLSQAGICSRRKADEYIEKGRVTINDEKAELGSVVKKGDIVKFDNKVVEMEDKKIVLAFNKPVGVVCTMAKFDKRNIDDYLNLPYRVYPVGRLDKDSSGLLLLTNDGDLAYEILRPKNEHERLYRVKINNEVTSDFLKKMERGVHIKDKEKNIDTVTRPCTCRKVSKNEFEITLKQGLNRQIRRMCQALGNRVISLTRIKMMNIELGNLKTGEYRELTDKEIRTMMKLLKERKKP